MVRFKGAISKVVAASLCLHLAACGGSGSGADEALELGVGMLSLGVAAAGLASAASGSGSPRSIPSSGGYRAPQTGNGYSQKGAFDDCAKLYGSVGASQQEAECRRRSANMSSLH